MQKLIISFIVMVSFLMSPLAAFADGHLKITDKPLELTIFMNHARHKNYSDEWPVEQKARELTNIHLNNITTNDKLIENYNFGDREILDIILLREQLPNIIGSTKLKDFVNYHGPFGGFLPLKELIDAHAPNLKAFFDKHPEIASAIAASDGNIYYIPYIPDGKYGRAYFIRYDWLDKLGLDVPTNVKELEETLIAFKERDPNGNGLADEVPVFFRHWQELARLVTLWDGRSSGSDSYHDFYVENGKIVHPYTKEGYRDGIANLSRWYDMGLIDKDIYTRGTKSRKYHLTENIGGMTHDWFASTAGFNQSLADKIDGLAFKAFAPPASISGVRMEEHRRKPFKPDGWAITVSNNYPIETIKYFDFWFSKEGRRLANFGVEGMHHDLNANGEAIFKYEILNNETPVNSQLYTIGAQLHTRGYHQDYNYEKQWTNQYALEGIALYLYP